MAVDLHAGARLSAASSGPLVAVRGARERADALITYPVTAGFTDCHFFRDLGIHSYGFSPFVAAPRSYGGGVHGNDERIGKQMFLDGVKFFYEVIAQLVQ